MFIVTARGVYLSLIQLTRREYDGPVSSRSILHKEKKGEKTLIMHVSILCGGHKVGC